MLEQLLAEAERAVEQARAAGADDVVASISRQTGFELCWRGEQLEKVQEDTSRRLVIALYVEGRFSTHATNDPDPARLTQFLTDAVALTRLLEQDPHRRIPDPALYAGRSEADLELFDPALEHFSRERAVELCRELHERAAAHPAVLSVTSTVQGGHGMSARASSNGFRGATRGSSFWYGAQVAARDGETKKPAAARVVGARHLGDMPAAAGVGDEALRRVLARLGTTKLASERSTMVLEPAAAVSLLGRVLGVLSAGAVQQGRSFLVGKRGEPIASPLLTLTDEPLLPRGMASRHYDGEGIAARPMPLVEDGVLANFYVDTYYGSKLDWPPTTCSRSNVVVEPGEHDLEALLAGAGTGFLVSGWLGGNANPTTGDFSFGFQGHRIEGGRRGVPVSEMNVTGNFLELLGRLVAVGNDPEPWSALRAPTLVFEGVQFSGR